MHLFQEKDSRSITVSIATGVSLIFSLAYFASTSSCLPWKKHAF